VLIELREILLLFVILTPQRVCLEVVGVVVVVGALK
jgi:hypothetical protein